MRDLKFLEQDFPNIFSGGALGGSLYFDGETSLI